MSLRDRISRISRKNILINEKMIDDTLSYFSGFPTDSITDENISTYLSKLIKLKKKIVSLMFINNLRRIKGKIDEDIIYNRLKSVGLENIIDNDIALESLLSDIVLLFIQKQEFSAFLKSKHFDIKHIEGDGNCLYRCLSYLLSGNEESNYKEIKKAIINHISQYKDDYKDENFFGNITNIEEYLKLIKKENEYGDDLCVKVFLKLLEIKFDIEFKIFIWVAQTENRPVIGQLTKVTENGLMIYDPIGGVQSQPFNFFLIRYGNHYEVAIPDNRSFKSIHTLMKEQEREYERELKQEREQEQERKLKREKWWETEKPYTYINKKIKDNLSTLLSTKGTKIYIYDITDIGLHNLQDILGPNLYNQTSFITNDNYMECRDEYGGEYFINFVIEGKRQKLYLLSSVYLSILYDDIFGNLLEDISTIERFVPNIRKIITFIKQNCIQHSQIITAFKKNKSIACT